MDTEMSFSIHNTDISLEDITIPEYSDEELHMICSYVEITRYVEEIHQLFLIFRYNLKRILDVYDLHGRDRVIRHKPHFKGFTDRTEINALVINYISSGKTLTDALDSCMKELYRDVSDEDNGTAEEYRNFKEYLRNIYDTSFSYRLLTRLRDFAQHGHVPVSIYSSADGDKMCFDIGQISATPHFNHNKAVLTEMQNFNEELLVKEGAQPRYVFTVAVAEYTVLMCDIYKKFWHEQDAGFKEKVGKIDRFVEDNPSYIRHRNKDMNGYLFYKMENVLHTFNASQDSMKMFSEYMQEADGVYAAEKSEFDEFSKSVRFVRMGEFHEYEAQ